MTARTGDFAVGRQAFFKEEKLPQMRRRRVVSDRVGGHYGQRGAALGRHIQDMANFVVREKSRRIFAGLETQSRVDLSLCFFGDAVFAELKFERPRARDM